MNLTVIIPALNEEATIGDVIGRLPRQIAGVDRVEIVVVDDGSSDRTGEIAAAAGALVVRHRHNRGVGAAFRSGLAAALDRQADIVVNMDADGQFNPADVPALIQPILDGRADMTTCTRFARKELIPEMPAIKKWGNRMMCRLINRICWNSHFTDVSCGFRAYSRQTAMQLTLFGDFTYTQESFIDLVAKGVQIEEVPLKVRGVREIGKSRVASNLWAYARQSAMIILRAARDIRPLAFFGSIGAILLAMGVLCGGIVFGWWLATGQTSPIRSLLIGSGAFLTLGFLSIMLALLADMLGRQRKLVEQLLAMHRDRRRQDADGPDRGGA
ncbi:MAG: Undecaprenyl-phosphate mannosyltransferase [Planctomycetes bacterium ADurb.Bin126]|nr:MAG: Undecaprenyl-phosphate mannosyltransferase [Planctomycetes bacterium ADurb.Bin126]HOD83813.1 glycosyltransferase family 2 protein [Phycisphaerae bacterium]HQL74298.1 glycosyltransferase family 2 protein [Phycisphaerae bacterium]